MFPSAPSRGRPRGEGECEGRGGHGTQMCPALHNLSQCLSVERRTGAVFHPCQPYPPSQSTFHLEPTHSSSGTLAAIRLGVRKTSFLPACCFSVSHSLSCEHSDLWANRKRCARVIAQLRSRWREGHRSDVFQMSQTNTTPFQKRFINFDCLGAVLVHHHFATFDDVQQYMGLEKFPRFTAHL